MDKQPLRVALYQPDIPGNMGAMIRLCAGLGVGLDVIEPCGFLWDDKRMDRSAMDYKDLCDLKRHNDWAAFQASRHGRLILLTTKGATDLYDFTFQPGDTLLAGRESVGAPDEVHAAADARIRIPMHGPARSLNVATACALVLGAALGQVRA